MRTVSFKEGNSLQNIQVISKSNPKFIFPTVLGAVLGLWEGFFITPATHLFSAISRGSIHGPSLKLTAKAPEKRWLEDDPFLLGRPSFRGELLVSGVISPTYKWGTLGWHNPGTRMSQEHSKWLGSMDYNLPWSSSSLYIWNLWLPGKPLYQVTIDPWWTKYMGNWKMILGDNNP